MRIVVDSSALLALVKKEPGHERVLNVIWDAVASPVILAESLGKAVRFGHDVEGTEAMLRAAGLQVPDLEISDVRMVAQLHALAKRNISLADRFCLALAMRLSLPLMTGDRPWANLGLPVELRFFR